MNQIIGRFVPTGDFNRRSMPFNVLTKESSDYMPPAWKGIREGGEEYHVIEKAWRFEPVEWNGDGLPPLGILCEVLFDQKSNEWFVAKIIAYDGIAVVGRWAEGEKLGELFDYGYTSRYFRPIRSEADKKRDEAIAKLIEVLHVGVNTEDDGKNIYEYIAAGKVPGIRID